MKIIVVGSIMVDMVAHCHQYPGHGESVLGNGFQITAGGKGANQAIACARMGGEATLVGAVGTDPLSDIALSSLKKESVGLENVDHICGATTGTAAITIDSTAENTIIVNRGANDLLSAKNMHQAQSLFQEAQGLIIQLELPLPVVEQAMRMAKNQGIPILLDPGPAMQISDDMLKLADIITPNHQETKVLTGVDVKSSMDAIKAAEILHHRGVNNVVIKRGGDGCLVSQNHRTCEVAGIQVQVLDTVGAGDCFAGALMVRWLECNDLVESCRFANAAAALKVQRHGAQTGIPSRNEVEELLQNLQDSFAPIH